MSQATIGYDGPVSQHDHSHAARARLLAKIPRGYRPWLHLAVPNVYGALVIAACVCSLEGPGPWQWSTLPLVFVAAQGIEWRFHRDLLHRRVPPLQWLYDAHAVSHHAVFVRGAMAIREARELRGVLFPWWAIVALTLLMAPFAWTLAALFGRDVGLLFLVATHAYLMIYEWLHTIYHLPGRSWILRMWPFRGLAEHHAVHHEPRWMPRANFGVTTPLWDWLRGTRRS